MRVGVVTTSYPRGPGDAAGTFVEAHVRWLRGQGHEVEIVAAGERAGAGAADLGAGITRVRAPRGLFYRGGAPEALEARRRALLGAGGFTLALAAAVARRARRWDRVVAHWLVPSGVVAATVSRAPLLVVAHSGDVHLLARLGLTGPVARILARRRARLAFVNRTLRRRFLAASPASVRAALDAASVTCPMGIDLERFRGLAAAPGADPPVLLFLGRLVPIKGVELLLEARAALDRPARLIIAGDGPERSRLERRACELGVDAEFRGQVPAAERDRLLAAASLLVVPSAELPGGRSEGMPLVVAEAMAAGVPVVATATGGLAELPPDAVRLVTDRTPRTLAAAMTALLDDPGARAAQVARAAGLVRAHDWATVGPRLWAHFDSGASRDDV